MAPLEVTGQNGGSVNRGGIQIDDRGDGCCSQLPTTSGHTIWHIYTYAGGEFSIYGANTHTGASGVGNVFNILDFGNVGIGTTNPTAKLDVAGNLKVEGAIVFPDGTTQTTASSPSRYSVCVSYAPSAPACGCSHQVSATSPQPGGQCTTSDVTNACSAYSNAGTINKPATYAVCCVCQ